MGLSLAFSSSGFDLVSPTVCFLRKKGNWYLDERERENEMEDGVLEKKIVIWVCGLVLIFSQYVHVHVVGKHTLCILVIPRTGKKEKTLRAIAFLFFDKS